MRAVLQRVLRAGVSVAGEVVGELDGPGLVVLLGVAHDDGAEQVAWMARKIREVRILRPSTSSGTALRQAQEPGTEQSLADTGGAVLVVSQFTLYGDARKGRRPTWQAAAPGPVAEPVYEAVCAELERLGTPVQRGRFGADMALELVNDGPVTLLLETPGTSSRPAR